MKTAIASGSVALSKSTNINATKKTPNVLVDKKKIAKN